jgi:CRISP-associated protein Cas1
MLRHPISGHAENAHWLEQQVAAWADPARRLGVATRMYGMRFADAELPDTVTLEQLRGLEGQRMKALYKILAQQHGIGRFRRQYHPDQWHAQDPVNLALSAANTCLYGIVHAALLALGLSPALGFVHAGTQHAFVYDVADLYKAQTTLPLAFALHQSANPDQDARRRFREDLRLLRLLPRIVADVQKLLTPQQTATSDDDLDPESRLERRDVEMVHLWDPQAGVLPAGVNYASGGAGDRHDSRARPPAWGPEQVHQRGRAWNLRRSGLGPRTRPTLVGRH